MMYYDKGLRLCHRHVIMRLLLPKARKNTIMSRPEAYHVPVVIDAVEGEVHERVGETLVEPKVVPPLHRHHVAEPLPTRMQQ